MQRVEAIANTNFTHGDITAVAGQACRHRNGDLISQAIAEDLEKHGLVRIRALGQVAPVAGKSEDDGAGQPSSVSPPAPVSVQPTSPKSKPGGKKTRKAGK